MHCEHYYVFSYIHNDCVAHAYTHVTFRASTCKLNLKYTNLKLSRHPYINIYALCVC